MGLINNTLVVFEDVNYLYHAQYMFVVDVDLLEVRQFVYRTICVLDVCLGREKRLRHSCIVSIV